MTTYTEAELYYKLDNMILSSCQYLRKIFQNRWKEQTGESWIDDQPQKDQLLSSLIPLDSKTKKCPLQAFQQKSIKEKEIGEWDLSLLSGILLLQQNGNQDTLKKENEAVRHLKNIRNALAHDDTGKNVKDDDQCSRRCSLEEFQKHAKTFTDSLLSLGVDGITIEKLIEKSGVTSSLKALERAKKLHKIAENLMHERQFDQAIDCFTDAISTPSLLPEHKAEAYEKRAECYLKYTDRIDTFCDQALCDASEALKLNNFSWKAHYILAQCYRHKNRFTKSIEHYGKALAISPVQIQVKRDLEGCQVLAGILIQNGDVNPEQLPDNLQELITKLEKEMGKKLSEEEFMELSLSFAATIKGEEDVFRGHQYYYGWGVLKNYTEAVKYYTKADKMGNPVGTYNLGLCYGFGRGVEQNVRKALQMYKRAGLMDPNTEGEQTTLQKNWGVAVAQHALGTAYQAGIGVDQNYYKAFVWFKKSMDNGLGASATCLGTLYFKGHGVELNENMAETCWKTALNWGDSNAAQCLVKYYIDQLEPEKALSMLKVGRQMGNKMLIEMSDKEINVVIRNKTRQRDEMLPKVVQHEERHNLSSKGWSFQRRVLRLLTFGNSDFLKRFESFKNGAAIEAYGEDGGRGVKRPIPAEAMEVVWERALNGSEIAVKVIEAMNYWNELYQQLMPIRKYSGSEEKEMVDLLYKSTVLQAYLDLPLNFPDEKKHLKSFIQQLFEQKCNTIGDEDMKIRICQVIYNLRGSWRSLTENFALEVLKEGVRRYPDNVTYYDYLSLSYSFKQNYSEAIYWANEGLKKFPNDINLLYGLALHSESIRNFSKAKDAFMAYLDAAPPDHVKVPPANYRLSSIYLMELIRGKEDVKSENQFLIEAHFRNGEMSEEIRLPCFVIPENIDSKLLVKDYLSSCNKLQNEKASAKQANPTNLEHNSPPTVASVLEKKPHLQSPLRKGLITFHREAFKNSLKFQNSKKLKNTITFSTSSTAPPKHKQLVPSKLTGMMSITLSEMNPVEDLIYENRFLELIILEEPNSFYYSIHCVAEDSNGDTTNLYIYNVEKNSENLGKFQPGCKMAILNPYLRIGALSNVNGIRNDQPDCIVHLKKIENACRFCGDENATKKCSKCKRPYCSPECQKLDWEILKHKLICFK